MTPTPSYPMRVIVAFDVFVNVLAFGKPDETISARVRRLADTHLHAGVWFAKLLNRALNFIQRDHGKLAEENDLARAQAEVATETQALEGK